MSVHDQIDLAAQTFNRILYPSTTYQQPRDIRLFKKFKGNELRIFLLFDYSWVSYFITSLYSLLSYRIFEIVEEELYDHLKALAFVAHMLERQYLSVSVHKDIEFLAAYFDERFVSLYTVRRIAHFFSLIIRFNLGKTCRFSNSFSTSFPHFCSWWWTYIQLFHIFIRIVDGSVNDSFFKQYIYEYSIMPSNSSWEISYSNRIDKECRFILASITLCFSFNFFDNRQRVYLPHFIIVSLDYFSRSW